MNELHRSMTFQIQRNCTACRAEQPHTPLLAEQAHQELADRQVCLHSLG